MMKSRGYLFRYLFSIYREVLKEVPTINKLVKEKVDLDIFLSRG